MSVGRVQVVWFKRDLRVSDHPPLAEAALRGPVVPLYLFEPSLLRSPEWDASHSRYIAESLSELDASLRRRGSALVTLRREAVEALEDLWRRTRFEGLWSHEETGNDLTFRRDRAVAAWCRDRGVRWREFRQDGVVRRLRSRDGWAARWNDRMSTAPVAAPSRFVSVVGIESEGILGPEALGLGPSGKPDAQRGGEAEARRTLETFLEVRGVDYRRAMSSPVDGWDSCSRLSPHLAWGCISMRTVSQAADQRLERIRWDRAAGIEVDRRWSDSLRSFQSRLRWHCHFMQKLEDEPRIEFANFVRAYDGLREEHTGSEEGRRRLAAWSAGRTGFPMVDACMRCVQATGWLNFRMRAMLVSVASHLLWLHWRPTAVFLARHFLDFEPGIHFSQFQMQSGTTGINAVRIYSPAKQAIDQDPQGIFIRRWIPELAGVPDAYLARPESMPEAIQARVGCRIGRDYPEPVVEFTRAYREARERLAVIRRAAGTRVEARRVFLRHGSRKGRGDAAVHRELGERGLDVASDRPDEVGSSRQLDLGL